MSSRTLRVGAVVSLLLSLGAGCARKDAVAPVAPAPAPTAPGPASPSISAADAEVFARAFAAAISGCDPEAVNAMLDLEELGERVAAGRRLPVTREQATAKLAATLCAKLGDEVHYQLLRLRIVDGQHRPLFRLLDDADDGVNYHELALAKGADGVIRAVDIYVYVTGEYLSESLGAVYEGLMVSAEQGSSFAGMGATMKQARELVAAGRHDEARAALAALPAALRATKALRAIEVQISSDQAEATYLAAIDAYRRDFPDDPSVELLLMDAFVLRQDYRRALQSIDVLDRLVGGDPYLEALRSLLHVELGDLAGAAELAASAITREPELYMGWAALLLTRIHAGDIAGAIATMDEVWARFGVALDEATMRADPSFAGLLASAEYAAWKAAHAP
jgi:hypothetical protein